MTDGTGPHIRLVIDKSKYLEVHYLETLGVSIGMENLDLSATMIIESLALRFKSRRLSPSDDNADPYTTVVHPGRALSIAPRKIEYCTVQVRPNLLFLRHTNS